MSSYIIQILGTNKYLASHGVTSKISEASMHSVDQRDNIGDLSAIGLEWCEVRVVTSTSAVVVPTAEQSEKDVLRREFRKREKIRVDVLNRVRYALDVAAINKFDIDELLK